MQHQNLKAERNRIGLNQQQLADRLGVNIKAIVRYENDLNTMPADFVKSAAEFFGCSTDYLLDISTERNPQFFVDQKEES